MDTFAKLFGSLVSFVYHCFDRIVILGYLPLLTRPENIVYFFRDVHQVGGAERPVVVHGTADVAAVAAAGAPLLDAESFASQTAYDALNRPTSLI